MTDPDGLGPRLESQLRSALDRVQPRFSTPRYLHAPARRWGAAQGVLAAGLAALMVLTLLAAAASRSIDLQHRIVNTIQSATEPSPAAPDTSPSPSPENVQQPAPPAQQPSPRPEPTDTPEPSQQPEPGDSSSAPPDEGSTSASPTPTDR